MSSSAPARERRRLPRRRPTVTADLIYDGFYVAAVGGSALGLFFLLVDSVDGQPFFTPSLMGTVLFTGVPAESVTEVRLDMVAYMTMIHMLLFGLFGMAVAIMVHEAELHSRHPKEVILALFLVLEIGFVVSANQFMPGVGRSDRLRSHRGGQPGDRRDHGAFHTPVAQPRGLGAPRTRQTGDTYSLTARTGSGPPVHSRRLIASHAPRGPSRTFSSHELPWTLLAERYSTLADQEGK